MRRGNLANADEFANLGPGFREAFDFLRRPDLARLPDGRHAIDGKRVFAIVAHDQGRGRDAARLEAHRKYIDIQHVVTGREVIGVRPTERCGSIAEPYSEERDIEFFADPPEQWVLLDPEEFVILAPEDAHAPLAGQGEVHKVVIKVAAM